MWAAELWTDPTVAVGASTFILVVGSALGLCYRLSRSVPRAYERQVEQMGEDLKQSRAETLLALRRNALLIRTLQQANVEVPSEVFDD